MSSHPKVAWRDPERVMRLKRLGSLHQSRLSFMRVLTRRMARDAWQFSRPAFVIDDTGVGHAIYTVQTPERAYSLVAFAHELAPESRSDRVIAQAWDATFCLFDGRPSAADVERLAGNVPLQEAGRISERELTLSRANRSVRLWEHVISALASGNQPDSATLEAVGYLMRTTAVYGSGKFGAADREAIADRPEMQAPFQAEMLTVYLIRTFVRDLVQHMASVRGGKRTVELDPTLARQLGIGNSTGLGMAPFIVNHPVLFNNWLFAREEAIARVRSVESVSSSQIELFHDVLRRTNIMVSRWQSSHPVQQQKLIELRADLAQLNTFVAQTDFKQRCPWNILVTWSDQALTEEGQELLASMILEPYGELVDGLIHCMADSNTEASRINGAMPVGELRALIEHHFDWALNLDWHAREHSARVWYVSEEKLEPRLGERIDESLCAYEQPLAPARDTAAVHKSLAPWADDEPIASFLLQHPEHRHTVRRLQLSRIAPYAEIRDNTIADAMLPIDMLRAKLSFFGATHFDPRSDRWVRICMYAGAPYPEELSINCADYWVYPQVVQ